MDESLFVSVELGEKCAHLHMSFALILVFLESLIDKVVNVGFETLGDVDYTSLDIERTLL
jgi:hypothetical protein